VHDHGGHHVGQRGHRRVPDSGDRPDGGDVSSAGGCERGRHHAAVRHAGQVDPPGVDVGLDGKPVDEVEQEPYVR